MQTLVGEQQRLPCQAGVHPTRGRDCHRERDSPRKGLSARFLASGIVGVNQKRTIQPDDRLVASVNISGRSRISRIALASEVGLYGFCR